MKKIVSAVLAGALASGIAFADVSVKMNSRTYADVFSSEKSEKETKNKFMNMGSGEWKDDLTLTASGENCGAVAKLTLTNGKPTYNAAGTLTDTAAQGISLAGEYYGWLAFGNFKVTAGRFDSRFTPNLALARTEESLSDKEIKKWGLSKNIVGFDAGKASFLYDFNNFSALAGTRMNSIVCDYTFKLNDDMKLLTKLGMTANTYASKDNANFCGCSFAAELALQAKFGTLEALFKKPTVDTTAFGIYANIKAVKNLTLAAGFTMGLTGKDAKASEITLGGTFAGEATAFAIDGKVGYNFSGFETLFGIKYSSAKADGADAETALDMVLTGAYKINKTFQTELGLELDIEDLDDNDKAAKVGDMVFKVRPAVKISASSAAAITLGFQGEFNMKTSDEAATSNKVATKIAIPMIMRIKL